MRTISSVKIWWDKYSPSILIPLFSQLILLMMVYWRHDVNDLGEMLSPCLVPLPSSKFLLSLWSRGTDVASLEVLQDVQVRLMNINIIPLMR